MSASEAVFPTLVVRRWPLDAAETAALPQPHEVHLWWLDTRAAEAMPGAAAALTPDESQQAARLRHEEDRAAFVFRRAASRAVLSSYLGVSSAAVPWKTRAHGAPHLGTAAPFAFNLSHTRGCSLLGIAPPGWAIGVDIEHVERRADIAGIARRFFHPNEQAWLRAQGETMRAFLTIWTRKEAVIKAAGVGLRADLPALDTLSLSNRDDFRVLPVLDQPGWLRDLDVADYLGALAISPSSQGCR